MKDETQKELLQELKTLHSSRTAYNSRDWHLEPVDHYTSPSIFERERVCINAALPQIAAHSSQLPEPGSFLTLEMAAQPLLLSRDEHGDCRAFLNVCRHRGAQLVSAESGCSQRFSCPYHAWTYSNSGDLIAVPHEKQGFPDLDRQTHGLQQLPCEEFAGWIWVRPDGQSGVDARQHLAGLAADIEAMNSADHIVFDTTVRRIAANWKILVEGGLEAYHFRVAHKHTIAPLFLDNLSSYQCFNQHIRSILPRSTLADLSDSEDENWSMRKHANVLYTLFPGSQFLVQDDHFVWIQGRPLAPDLTELRMSTMIPAASNTADQHAYWRKNHDLTIMTLNEDFDLGESIQKGLASGANTHLNFGRFEGALTEFNQFVAEAIT